MGREKRRESGAAAAKGNQRGSSDPAGGELVGIREYARRRGVSHTAVQKAIQAGRLKGSLVLRGKRVLIDPGKADQEWTTRTDAAKQRRGRERIVSLPVVLPAPVTGGEKAGTEAPLNLDPLQVDYMTAKSAHEAYDAMLAALKYEAEAGRLVRREEVTAETYRTARAARDRLLNIPSRIRDQLATLSDVHAIGELLEQEIHAALEVLSAG